MNGSRNCPSSEPPKTPISGDVRDSAQAYDRVVRWSGWAPPDEQLVKLTQIEAFDRGGKILTLQTEMEDPGSPSGVCDALASAWERHRSRLFESAREVSEWLIDQVGPEPGDTVLELGAGPGETGFLAAERVGPAGRLISTDLGPAMVEAARRGAQANGLANVECRVMDAQKIELGDASVDGVISRFAVMLMASPQQVFSESLRVLRPGRRLAYAVWGPAGRNPWLTALGAALADSGHLPDGDAFGPGGVCSLAQPKLNRQLLADAGFSDIRVEEITGVMRFEDLDDYWDLQSQVAGALALLAGSLGPAEVARVRNSLGYVLAPFAMQGVYSLPSVAVVVSAA